MCNLMVLEMKEEEIEKSSVKNVILTKDGVIVLTVVGKYIKIYAIRSIYQLFGRLYSATFTTPWWSDENSGKFSGLMIDHF